MKHIINSKQIHFLLLLEISKILGNATPSSQKITTVLDLLSKWGKLYFGRVMLPNYQTRELEVAFSIDLLRENIEAGQYTVKFNKGLTGYVWRLGQVALVTDVLNENIFLSRIAEPIEGSKHHVGFICVPILVDTRPIGVLSVQRRSNPRRRYSDDVDLLRVIATLLAPVLQRLQTRARNISYDPDKLDHDSGRWLALCESHGIIGASKELLSAIKQIEKVKNSDAPIMLLGESGTGKEVFAGMAHKESNRSKKPFICINCASIPDTLLESELFGHEKGSFTGAYKRQQGKIEQAHEGTLFLDEIGDMPLDLQAKLLRVMQDKHIQPVGSDKPRYVDFRLITATHVNLSEAVADGRFRLDLFYRLNVIPVSLPSLRQRIEDIPRLAQHFLSHYGQLYDKLLHFTQGVHEILCAYSWPGNVRQLQNVIERAVLQADENWITVDQIEQILNTEILPVHVRKHNSSDDVSTYSANYYNEKPRQSTPTNTKYRPYNKVNNEDLDLIMDALKKTGGNQTQAARLMGYSVRQLRYRLKKLQQK